tara:strand:- start:480 stop:587 length:108 start_codon:yes stop_codon:yes gene_type:complete
MKYYKIRARKINSIYQYEKIKKEFKEKNEKEKTTT